MARDSNPHSPFPESLSMLNFHRAIVIWLNSLMDLSGPFSTSCTNLTLSTEALSGTALALSYHGLFRSMQHILNDGRFESFIEVDRHVKGFQSKKVRKVLETDPTSCKKVKCTSNEMFRTRPPLGALKPDDNVIVSAVINAPRATWADHKGEPEGAKRLYIDFKKEGEEEKQDDRKEEKKDDKKEEKNNNEKKEEKEEKKKDEEKKDEKEDHVEKDHKKDEKRMTRKRTRKMMRKRRRKR
ncbi:hypothetical protein KIN20_006406 [Parelaphostrongylus tenuis]|uniref:MSP domain-containing protein n=1 Tax=Parelaphostrongylus tenuis TaxID=148309 RepID=A0AAD5M1Q5_PARTN|nr:hypothetical protein KIN20_006406 [Parelaphostrongylus tenuis]